MPPEISITHSARIPRAIFTHAAARSGVIESEPVVRSTACLHRVFLQRPQTWRGFSGIPNPRLRSRQLSHEAPRQRGNSAKMRQKIQCGPFAAEDRAGIPLDLQNLGAGLHKRTIVVRKNDSDLWI